jgi:hypothetical protein
MVNEVAWDKVFSEYSVFSLPTITTLDVCDRPDQPAFYLLGP